MSTPAPHVAFLLHLCLMEFFPTLTRPLGSRQEMKMCWPLGCSGLGEGGVAGLSASTILLCNGETEAGGNHPWVCPHRVYSSPQPSSMPHQMAPLQPLTTTPALSLLVSLKGC